MTLNGYLLSEYFDKSRLILCFLLDMRVGSNLNLAYGIG